MRSNIVSRISKIVHKLAIFCRAVVRKLDTELVCDALENTTDERVACMSNPIRATCSKSGHVCGSSRCLSNCAVAIIHCRRCLLRAVGFRNCPLCELREKLYKLPSRCLINFYRVELRLERASDFARKRPRARVLDAEILGFREDSRCSRREARKNGGSVDSIL